MLKKAQVIMLPTNKNSSNIAKSINQDILSLYNKNDDKYNQWINQNLYIISNDEIKEGDWYYNSRLKQIFQAIRNSGYSKKTDDYKIIATTDTSLIENIEMIGTGSTYLFKLPQPSQQFIEKYIESYNKGEVITDVLVEYEFNDFKFMSTLCTTKEKEYNLKVNLKYNTITIKKVKENWNREEVLNLLYDVNRGVFRYEANFDLDKFIEENL